MARTGKKSTSSKSTPNEVDILIAFMVKKNMEGDLCSAGQERLLWWVTKGRKYSTIASAMKRWSVKQKEAFYRFFGLARGNVRELRNTLNNHKRYLKDAQENAAKYAKIITQTKGQIKRHKKPYGPEDVALAITKAKAFLADEDDE